MPSPELSCCWEEVPPELQKAGSLVS